MIESVLYILTGAVVGIAVGMTGVGGGSLMTPLLLMFGYPAPVAIGTDLLYAGITKGSGVIAHHRQRSVNWRIVIFLCLGSLPASLVLNLFVMDAEFRDDERYEALLTSVLGFMLMVTALVIACQERIQQRLNGNAGAALVHLAADRSSRQSRTDALTILAGLLLGVCVTLSSVGAGAFGAAVLFLLYPRLRAVNIIGSDIAHAVPLTLVAGLGYLYYGLVDFMLLGALLCGSLPGIWLGSRMASKLPDKLLRGMLVIILLVLGLNLSFFSGAH